MPLDVRCMYSSVRNTSGVRKKFGFLPPHGKELAAGEEYTVYGDVREAVVRFERTEARRNMIALEAALMRGDLDIIHTAAPILHDAGNAGAPSKQLQISAGTLGVADACWHGSSSAVFSPEDLEVGV